MKIFEKLFQKTARAEYRSNIMSKDTYESLYETQAESMPATSSVGDGDFDFVGKLEKAILLAEGMEGNMTLLDFGCGVGRLAVHIIPELSKGRYIGTDISTTMLKNAANLINKHCKNSQCNIRWVHQKDYSFRVPEGSVDFICAFSVFTHMEHEDTFRYLKEAKKSVKVGGKFIFSCLPVNTEMSKSVFLGEAALDFEKRWCKVRNVITSIELMENISRMAGWEVMKWIPGDAPNIYIDGNKEPYGLGQSVCVLRNRND